MVTRLPVKAYWVAGERKEGLFPLHPEENVEAVFWESREEAVVYFARTQEGRDLASQLGIGQRSEPVQLGAPGAMVWPVPLQGRLVEVSRGAQPEVLLHLETDTLPEIDGTASRFWSGWVEATFTPTTQVTGDPRVAIAISHLSGFEPPDEQALGYQQDGEDYVPDVIPGAVARQTAIELLSEAGDSLRASIHAEELIGAERGIVEELALPAIDQLVEWLADPGSVAGSLTPDEQEQIRRTWRDLEITRRVLERAPGAVHAFNRVVDAILALRDLAGNVPMPPIP